MSPKTNSTKLLIFGELVQLYAQFDHIAEASAAKIRMVKVISANKRNSDLWIVLPTCSHSFLEKQYTIPDSLFGYDSLIKFATSSMTTFPTGDFSYTYMVNKFCKYNKAS